MPNTDMPSNGSRAPLPPSLEDSSSSLVEVDSQHIKSEASENAQSAKEKAIDASEKTKEKSATYAQEAREKANEAAKYSKEKGSDFADDASVEYDKAKKNVSKGAKSAEKEIKGAGQDISDNRDNPVVIANGVLIVAGSAALGYAAYTKHVAGELNWKIAATWAGAVGAVAVGDYYLSQYLFKNKYPKK
ncbi:hypothetical protein ACLMJK_001745 [Lecanora helva]